MDATTTPSTTLLQALKKDFPDISFVKSDLFHWSPEKKTVYYRNTSDSASLMHEIAHASLGHAEYGYDIELLKMERDAWEYARSVLAKKYQVKISADQADMMLDTYRDWMHSRSLCPNCQATGIQSDKNRYTCLACTNSWKVNEARSCALRRYKIK